MATYRTITSDIVLLLKQDIDDREIAEAQVMYWVLVVADRLRMLHGVKRSSGAYVTTFVLDIQNDADLGGRRYVTIPGRIYDLDMDGAIKYMKYFIPGSDGQFLREVAFWRTTPAQARSQAGHPDRKPSPHNPQMYREGDRIYLLGVDQNAQKVEAGLALTLPNIEEITDDMLDQELPFPAELIMILQRHVMDLGRWTLSVPKTKLENDGTERGNRMDPDMPMPGKTTSVNDPIMQQGE